MNTAFTAQPPPPTMETTAPSTVVPQQVDQAVSQYEHTIQSARTKKDPALLEQKKRMEEALIAYMETNHMTFLPYRDRYLVLETTTQKLTRTDEIIVKCYVAFHNQNLHSGSTLEQAAVRFLEFMNGVQRRSGSLTKKISFQRRRPMGAMLASLLSAAPAQAQTPNNAFRFPPEPPLPHMGGQL